MSQLSRKTLKYISSINFSINPMSGSEATRSMRLLLSTMPTKPVKGQNAFPQSLVSTTANDETQQVQVTYSDKKSISLVPEGLNIRDLIRKIEEPARLLRAKEEGI